MIFIILNWFNHQPTPVQAATFFAVLLAAIVLVVVVKTLCGLVDVVFDQIELRASASQTHKKLEE